MTDFSINEMLDMQKKLQDKYKAQVQFGGYSNGEISDVGNRTCNGNEML